MIQKRIVFVFLAILVSFFKYFPISAQDESKIWGVWEGSTENWAFYPDGTFSLYDYDVTGVKNVSGTYNLEGNNLYINSPSLSMSYSIDVNNDVFSILANGMGLNRLYSKMLPIDSNTGNVCAGNLQSHLIPGLAGYITSLGSPMNLRSEPNTSSTILEKMPVDDRFAVIGETSCGEGYTWWNVKSVNTGNIGWLAEGSLSQGYFIQPVPEVTDRNVILLLSLGEGVNTLLPESSSSGSEKLYSCGGSLQTNLYVGATAEIGYISPIYPFQVFNEPNQDSGLSGNIPNGASVVVQDGPICDRDVMWWKIYAQGYGVTGWVPEVTTSNRYVLRTTTDKNDTTAVYDPLYSLPYNYYIEPMIPMRLYSATNTNSSVTGVIWPGNAYQIQGTNDSGGMFLLSPVDNSSQYLGWVCGDLSYLRTHFPSGPMMSPFPGDPTNSGSNYNCSWEDYVFSTEELFTQAGATVYQPGQYVHQDSLNKAVASTPEASMLVDMVGYVLFVKDVSTGEADGVDLICAMINVWSIGNTATYGAFPEPDADASVTCILLDFGKNVLIGQPIVGFSFLMAEILANPDKYIDPWLDKVNAWTDSMPLTRTFCYFFPNICVGGPGAR